MIKTQGTLLIKKIRQSRNGAFCIADLSTEFGEFKVKDPLLDQFDEGEYQGTVWISEIYLAQYISYGKAVTEMRARLHDLQIDFEDRQTKPSFEPIEPDPIDEPATYHVQPVPVPAALPGPSAAPPANKWDAFKKKKDKPKVALTVVASSQGVADAASDSGDGDNLAQLFDAELLALIKQGAAVKLDASADRTQLRAQVQALRRHNYSFNSKQQIWTLLAS